MMFLHRIRKINEKGRLIYINIADFLELSQEFRDSLSHGLLN